MERWGWQGRQCSCHLQRFIFEEHTKCSLQTRFNRIVFTALRICPFPKCIERSYRKKKMFRERKNGFFGVYAFSIISYWRVKLLYICYFIYRMFQKFVNPDLSRWESIFFADINLKSFVISENLSDKLRGVGP